jgi:hypothetical protein
MWMCVLCKKGGSKPILRSREIVNVCMSCDVKVKDPEIRGWLRERFGFFVFDPSSGRFVRMWR